MITDEDKERVRAATDFLQLVEETVELKARGGSYWGRCPFHADKSPSFHVDPAMGVWKCFGCGKGGDLYSYVMERESLDFPDAIRYLADRAGIELSEERTRFSRGPKRNRLVECLSEAERFYTTILLRGKGEAADAARSYLAQRGFGSSLCRSWSLGFAPGHAQLVSHLMAQGFTSQEIVAADLGLQKGSRLNDRFFNRVMFPIHDELGKMIAFGGRVIGDGKPKYLNTKETTVFQKGKHLFAFDRAKEQMAALGCAIVCEGYTDVIAMHEAGFTNTVATLGTALTLDHVKLIERFARKKIICMFDGDAAGQMAAERAIRYIDKTKAELVCVTLPNNQDPAEFLAVHPADDLQKILDAARPLMDFVFERQLASFDVSVPGQRVEALEQMAKLLAPLAQSILLDTYATQLADLLGVDIVQVKQRVKQAAAQQAQENSSFTQEERTSFKDKRAPQAYGAAQMYEVSQNASPHLSLSALSSDERMQVVAERELLCLLAAHSEVVRPYGERLASFRWADAQHEAMAWAMLATPQGTQPSDMVQAARSVCNRAAHILSGGRLRLVSRLADSDKAAFLVDMIEFWSCKREVREIKAQLRSLSGQTPDAHSQELFVRATELQKKINELGSRLSSIV